MKSLSEMTLEELWELFPIILKKYNEDYPNWYANEKDILMGILGNEIKRISHYGSTSIKGIISKPCVDILIELYSQSDIEKCSNRISFEGWTLMSESDSEKVFCKGYTLQGFADKVFHLHLRYYGDHNELYFRDYISEHEEVAREYELLKLKLLERHEKNRDAYTEAKSEFINKYTLIAKQLYNGRYK